MNTLPNFRRMFSKSWARSGLWYWNLPLKPGKSSAYQMPGYYLNGGLVWFGAYKKHIGFYPLVSSDDEDFNRELAAYRGTKGSLHFPLDKPMPYDLIRKIIRQRLTENLEKGR